MSLINISNLTFNYETGYENIFENVSFQIDTDWKLGFIGRNGRGKTTFLNILMGKLEYNGNVSTSVSFDYFPYEINDKSNTAINVIKNIIAPYGKWEDEMKYCLELSTPESILQYSDLLEIFLYHDGYIIDELIKKEALKLNVNEDTLARPFNTLSNGEQTKLMISALFLKKNNFLLIDEPTNHLDTQGRKIVSEYISSKKGFILVSHDREFIDGTVDHILSINRNNIEIQKGNFTTWQENKSRQDNFEISENEKLKKDISKLQKTALQKADWSNKIEKSKIGSHSPDRGFIGHKAAKMMKRAKSIEGRCQNAIEEKSTLLKNIENNDALKILTLPYTKERLAEIKSLSINYGNNDLFKDLSFTINSGERIAICGKNGSGKSSILKLLLNQDIPHAGTINKGSNLIISYVPQDTSYLKGTLKDYAISENIDESLFKAILRKLDFSRTQFDNDISELSGGQKKKVLIAKSLSEHAHLYIWDEPLNFIDILSRIQIEKLIIKHKPTMVFVEHDNTFSKNIATKYINM